ncbi:MAG: hypothetical protein ACO3YX_07000, partial [Candidatus Nanopelagicaceae bacterium]
MQVKHLAEEIGIPPSICVHKTRGGKCSTPEGEVNQIPAMGMFLPTLQVMCTANGLGYPELTSVL